MGSEGGVVGIKCYNVLRTNQHASDSPTSPNSLNLTQLTLNSTNSTTIY